MNNFLLKVFILAISFVFFIISVGSTMYTSSLIHKVFQREKLLKIKKKLDTFEILVLFNIVPIFFSLLYANMINSQEILFYCGLSATVCALNLSIKQVEAVLSLLDIRTNTGEENLLLYHETI